MIMSDKVKSNTVFNSQMTTATNLWSKLTDNEKFSLYSNSYGENELLKSEYKDNLKEKERIISSLKKSIDLVTKRNEAFSKKNELSSEKNGSLQNSILEMKNELDRQVQIHDKQISDLMAEISQKDVMISNHEKTIEGYVNSSERNIIDLEEKLSAKEEKIGKLNTTIWQMEFNQKQLHEKIKKYQEEEQDREDRGRSDLIDFIKLDKQIRDLQDDILVKDERIQELENLILVKDKRIKELEEKDLESVKTDFNSSKPVPLVDPTRKKKEDHAMLKKENIKLKDNHAELKDFHARLKQDYANLEGDYAKLKEDYANLEGNYDKLKDSHAKLKDDFKDKSILYTNNVNEILKLNEEISKLRLLNTDHEERNKEIEDIKAECESFSKKVEHDANEAINKVKKEFEDKLANANKEIGILRDKNKSFKNRSPESSRKSVSDNEGKLEKELQALRKECENLLAIKDDELSELKSELSDKNELIKSLQEQQSKDIEGIVNNS